MKTMKRYLISLIILLWVCAGQMNAKDGLPFFVNYSPAMYHAHNRNFDIVSDDYGRVYVANFEGVLYYDQTEWHTLHAPGIFRVTKLFKDSKGRIWVGGYNLFGYLTSGENGALELQLIFSKNNKGFLGEVTGIEEVNGKICVTSSLGDADIQDDSMDDFILRRAANAPAAHYQGVPVNKRIDLPDGSALLATAGAGFVMLDKTGEERYTLTEQNGLCNNNVNGLYVDASGYVWGATDNGIFVVNVQTAYTYFRSTEGLSGEVQSICQTDHGLYVGTLRGLFYREADTFEPVKPIQQACWQLQQDEDGYIYASTAGGLFSIKGKQVRQITDNHTLSTYICGDGEYYTGEVDGVYRIQNGERKPLNIIEKATFFYKDDRQTLWIRNIFGQVFRCEGDYSQYQITIPQNARGEKDGFNNTLFIQNGHIHVLSHVGLFRWNSEQQRLEEQTGATSLWTSSNQYPRFIYPESERIWGTNNEGKELYVYSTNNEDTGELNALLRPVHDLTVGTIEVDGKDVWLGGNFGLIHWDASMKEPDYPASPRVFIRRISINNDSLIWGGFGQGDQLAAGLPFKETTFESGIQEIKLNFSADKFSTLGAVEYRYRMDRNERWSDWSTETSARFANPRSGHYTFQVMARDRYGRVTEAVSLPIHIRYPFYLRWYSLVAYVLVLALGIQQLIRWRMKRLIHLPRYREGVIAQFFYVGAQIMCWTFIIQYGTHYFMLEGMDERSAEVLSQRYNIYAMVLFCCSRFICTFILRYLNPGQLLMILAICAGFFTLGVIGLENRYGVYCLVGVSGCMSLMFPTIYGIALEGLGDDAKFGAAGLIMAILGGSVLPPVQASIIDLGSVGGFPAVNLSFVLPLICFIVVAAYGFRTFRRKV